MIIGSAPSVYWRIPAPPILWTAISEKPTPTNGPKMVVVVAAVMSTLSHKATQGVQSFLEIQ